MNEDDAYWCNHRDTILRLRDYKSNYQNGNHIVECSYKENYLTKSIASIVQSIQKQVSTSIQDNIMRGYFTDNVKEYSKSQCEEYLKNYPNGSFVNEVKQRLTSINEKLKKDEDFGNSNKNSIEGINRYKALFPNGIHITDIESQTKKIEKEQLIIAQRYKTYNHIRAIIGWSIIVIGIILGIFCYLDGGSLKYSLASIIGAYMFAKLIMGKD